MSIAHGYPNPVEQVMFILGFKRDLAFPTILHAVVAGAPTGLTDAADVVRIYGSIHANFAALASMRKKLETDFGESIPPDIRPVIHGIVLDELTEENYGGRWYRRGSVPRLNWITMEQFSPVFATPEAIFCLPEPYVTLLKPLL